MEEPLYFVHISDSHIGPTPGYSRHGHVSLPCSQRAVDLISRLPQQPDFVIHTGDITTDPEPAAYELAAGVFNQLGVPTYYANGNHDTAADIRHYMQIGPTVWADSTRLTYGFKMKGVEVLVLDGRGPDEIDPHGRFTRAELSALDRAAVSDGPPLLIFTHFPLLPLNSPWMDRNMLVENGTEAHELLRRLGGRLRGVFHGHVHQNMQTVRDGVLYVAVASLFSQFTAWPADVDTGFDPAHPPGYNFVHVLPEQTIIHQHTFRRP